MADLIYPPDYAGQIAQAASIQPNAADIYSQAALRGQEGQVYGQQAQGLAIANFLAKLKLPLQAQAIKEAGQPTDYAAMINQGGDFQVGPPVEGAGPKQPSSGSNYIKTSEDEDQATPSVSSQDAPTPVDYAPGTELTSQQVGSIKNWMSDVAQKKFSPIPEAPPPQEAAKIAHLESAGLPDLANAEKAKYLNFVQNQNQQRAIDARKAYQKLYSIKHADNPRLMHQTLHSEGMDLPEHLSDDQIKDYASTIGGVIAPWTGLKFSPDTGGVIRDEEQRPVLGQNTPRVGLSQEQQTDAWNFVNDRVRKIGPGGAEETPFRWKDQGYKSPMDAYEARLAAAQVNPGTGAPGENGPPQSPNATPTPQKGPGSATPKVPQGAAVSSPNAPDGKVDFSDAPPSQIPSWTSERGAKPGEEAKIPMATKANQDAQDNANAGIEGASRAITENQKMLTYLGTAATGPLSDVAAKFQTLATQFGWNPTLGELMQNPASAQILSKMLAVGSMTDLEKAVQAAGGGSIRFSGLMANLAQSKTAPNTAFTKDAIKQMLQWGIANNSYDKQKYSDLLPKLSDPKNPGSPTLDGWYENKYPRSEAIPRYQASMDSLGKIHNSPGAGWVHKTDSQHRRAWVSPDGKKVQVIPQ